MRRAWPGGILVCLLVLAPQAVAAGGGWSFQSYPTGRRVDSGGQLTAVSCSSSTACTAVGNATWPYRWDGSRWRAQSTPSADGAYWLLGVSCPRVSDCTAVGISARPGSRRAPRQPLAEQWDGSKWTIERTPRVPGASGLGTGLSAVSCSSPRACIAVGGYGKRRVDRNWSLAERWNGHRWTIQHIPSPAHAGFGLELNAISCSSARACTAVGSVGGAYPSYSQGHVLVVRWDGRRWSVQQTAGSPHGVLLGVSCPSANSCFAVGFRGQSDQALAEHWNGKAWTLQHVPHDGELRAVSCTSVRDCTAVGGPGNSDIGPAERWNGRRWSSQSMPDPADYFLDAVSCPSASYCAAVGQTEGGSYPSPVIEHWTG